MNWSVVLQSQKDESCGYERQGRLSGREIGSLRSSAIFRISPRAKRPNLRCEKARIDIGLLLKT